MVAQVSGVLAIEAGMGLAGVGGDAVQPRPAESGDFRDLGRVLVWARAERAAGEGWATSSIDGALPWPTARQKTQVSAGTAIVGERETHLFLALPSPLSLRISDL